MKEIKDSGYKQLIVHIDPEILKEIKKRAINLNITLKSWVLQAIAEKISREDRVK